MKGTNISGFVLDASVAIAWALREDDPRAEVILQVLRAAGVIAVAVAHDRVFDPRRIQPELS